MMINQNTERRIRSFKKQIADLQKRISNGTKMLNDSSNKFNDYHQEHNIEEVIKYATWIKENFKVIEILNEKIQLLDETLED